jgi:indoleamine 2,3-dioxygenase
MLEVSTHLGLPPIATYAGLNLWNFAPIIPNEPLSMENLTCLHTITGTKDEAWFFLISVAMEARGGEIVPAVMRALDAVRSDNATVVRDCLLDFAESLRDIGVLLNRMYERCNPDVFYHQIRPFLAGTKNMAKAGLPNGVFYEEEDGKGEWRQNSGGSNAQSSFIQFFDVVLGVEHGPTGGGGGKQVYLSDMRNYMPGPHRAFLNHMDTVSNIRQYVMESASGPDVMDAYNLAVQRLREFRDIHIQIVTKYIVIPSRKVPDQQPDGMNLAVASTNDKSKLKGTGGTDLIPFLKQSRDETQGATIE